MEVFELIANIITGVILASLCVMGLIGNSVTLLVLNSNREMRNQPINIYLTVLAVYDNGVLFTAFLMFCVPGMFELMGSDHQFIDPISSLGNTTSILHENVTTLNSAQVMELESVLKQALNSSHDDKEVLLNQTAFGLLVHQDMKWNSSTAVQTQDSQEDHKKKSSGRERRPLEMLSPVSLYQNVWKRSSKEAWRTLHDKETVILTSKLPANSTSGTTVMPPTTGKDKTVTSTTTSTTSTSTPSSEETKQETSEAKISRVDKRSNLAEATTTGQAFIEELKHNLETFSHRNADYRDNRLFASQESSKKTSLGTSLSGKMILTMPESTFSNISTVNPSLLSYNASAGSSIGPSIGVTGASSVTSEKIHSSTTFESKIERGNNEKESLSAPLIKMKNRSSFSTTSPSDSVMLPSLSLEKSSPSFSSPYPLFLASHASTSGSSLQHHFPLRRRRSRTRDSSSSSTSFSDSSRLTQVKDSQDEGQQERQELQTDDDSQATTYYYSKSFSSSSRPFDTTSSTATSRVSSYYPAVLQLETEVPLTEPTFRGLTQKAGEPSTSASFLSHSSLHQESDDTSSGNLMHDAAPNSFETFSESLSPFSSSSLISSESQGNQDHTSMDHEDSIPDIHFEGDHHLEKLNTFTHEDSSNETDNDYIYDIRVSYITFIYPLGMIAQSGSVWTTCLITAERYLAIAHPLKALTLSTKKRAVCSLLIVSIISFVYNIPRFFEIHVEEKTAGKPEFKQTDLRAGNVYYFWSYVVAAYLIFLYAIPLFLLSYLNTKIYQAIKKANRDRSSLSRVQDNELNIAYMLVLLVAIFVFCNLPAFIVSILEHFRPPFLNEMTNLSNFLVCFNSSVNFVVYCTFGRKFRERLFQTFCFGSRRVPRRETPIKIRTNHKASIVAETIV